MRRLIIMGISLLLLLAQITVVAAAPGAATTRIKDIAKVQGVRANQLVGYGLVVGLAGTGDSNKSTFTMQSIANMLKSFGVVVSASALKSKNAAAVMVTAQLPPFVKPGDTIDITVSSIGDAKSLQGGTLLQTPLKAGNGNVYAVGQGSVSIGGFSAKSGGASQQTNFLTAGNIPNGAMVERDVAMNFADNGNSITLALSQPDFTTASRISAAVDSRFGSISQARDPGTVTIGIPAEYVKNIVGFIAAIEELPVTPDNAAKVVINERTGTIVMGSNVTIDEVAVAQGGLSIRISPAAEVSQPEPFSAGKTVVLDKSTVEATEQKANLILLPASASVGDVVNALNAVGATPRDIMAILQAMKAAGALHAELQII